MKKLSSIVVLIICFVFLTSCFGVTLTIGNSGVTLSDGETDIYSTNTKYKNTCPSITAEELYNKNGIVVSTKNMEYSTQWDAYYINIDVTNKTSKPISCSIKMISVDGFSIDAYASSEILESCNATISLAISRSDVAIAGIERIKNIVFDIKIYNTETNNKITTISADIKTNFFDGQENGNAFNGTELYNKKGIVICAKTNDKTDLNSPLIFYFENNTDSVFSYSYDNVAYNGQMVIQWMSGSEILPHTKKVFVMHLYFLGNDPQIDSIENVSMKFSLCPLGKDGSINTGNMYDTPTLKIELD